MRYKIDTYGNETKKPETAEEYLLLEIERLKEENEKLKKENEILKDSKRIYFVLDWKYTKGSFNFTYDEKEAKIIHLEEKNNDK